MLFSTGLFAQKQTVFAYMDYNNFFHSFKDGYFNQVDHQAVTNIAYGDEVIAYYNNQRDFKIYDGNPPKPDEPEVDEAALDDLLDDLD